MFDIGRSELDAFIVRRAGRSSARPDVPPASTHDVLASMQIGRAPMGSSALFDEARDFVRRATERLGRRAAILALVRFNGEDRQYFSFEQLTGVALLCIPLDELVLTLVLEADTRGADFKLRAGATEHFMSWLWVRRAWFGESLPAAFDVLTLENKGLLRRAQRGALGRGNNTESPPKES
jgi:hypothetical protein